MSREKWEGKENKGETREKSRNIRYKTRKENGECKEERK